MSFARFIRYFPKNLLVTVVSIVYHAFTAPSTIIPTLHFGKLVFWNRTGFCNFYFKICFCQTVKTERIYSVYEFLRILVYLREKVKIKYTLHGKVNVIC